VARRIQAGEAGPEHLYFDHWRGPSGLERQPSEVHLQRKPE
jgi:hypothetical protein